MTNTRWEKNFNVTWYARAVNVKNCGMEKPSIDVVLKALAALYNGTNPKETEEASKWLMQLQRSVCLNSAHPLCTRTILKYSFSVCLPVPTILAYISC